MESIFSVSLFVLRVLHPGYHPQLLKVLLLQLPPFTSEEKLTLQRVSFLKRERVGKVWNTVTVGVQGGRSGRFGTGSTVRGNSQVWPTSSA